MRLRHTEIQNGILVSRIHFLVPFRGKSMLPYPFPPSLIIQITPNWEQNKTDIVPDLFHSQYFLLFSSEIECGIDLQQNTGCARYGKFRRSVHREATKSGRTRARKHWRGRRIGENETGAPSFVLQLWGNQGTPSSRSSAFLSTLQYRFWFQCSVVDFMMNWFVFL